MTFGFAVLNESVRPASLSMVSDLVEPAQRKAAFALSRLAANLGMSVGPAIGGILAVYSFRWLFLVDGTTSILAGAVLALAPMRNLGRQKTHEPEWADATDLGREIEADTFDAAGRAASRGGSARVPKSAHALFSGGDDSGAAGVFSTYVHAAAVPGAVFAFSGIRVRNDFHGEHFADCGAGSSVEHGDGALDAPAGR